MSLSNPKLAKNAATEQELHDEFYAGLGLTDEQLMQAAAPSRLELYRHNPDRAFVPKQCQIAMLGDLTDKVVCDYACGDGANSILLAANGARKVLAFDISSSAVELTRRRARLCGFEERISVNLDDAENLSYESGSFDAIFGGAILHHLDVAKAAKEVRRVLKPGGVAVFCEPFDQSRLLAAMAKVVFAVTPLRPDAVSPQRQLNDADIALLRSIFSTVDVRPFGLFSRLERIPGSQVVLRGLLRFDAMLLAGLPSLMSYARYVVIGCRK